MKRLYKHLSITTVLSLGFGLLATWLVIKSENGYVAGFVFFPLFLLITLITLALIIAGIAMMALGKNFGPWLLLAALLLPGSFVGSALIAKHFEVGAYREDPMVPLIPEVSNIVLFKKDVTATQIEEFWNEVLAKKRSDDRGNEHLPGLRATMHLLPQQGYEAGAFDLFDTATDEQRGYVYSRVRSSPVVFKLLENVPTHDYTPAPKLPSNDDRSKKEIRNVNAPSQ